MDEYQHMENFSMDNDYSGGQWIGGEFYYSSRKKKRNQTREEALYGDFNEDSDDSDGDESSRRKRRDVVKKGDLTKPVNFISTGTFMPSEEAKQTEEEKEDEGEEDEEDEEAEDKISKDHGNSRPGLGSGSSSSGLGFGVGLGFAGSSAEDVEQESLLSFSAFGKRVQEGAEKREKERKEKKEREKEKSSVSFPKSRGISSSSGGAEFEKHTKGIGMKLLEKMGYKGGGLGKNQQGIAVPIEAKLRPKNMGMGFNDYKEASNSVAASSSGALLPGIEEIEEKKVKEHKAKEKLWLKKFKGKKKNFKTADDLLLQKSEQEIEHVQTILDMRGPQVRVLKNLEHINAEQTDIEDDVPMPELQHNIRLIVDLVEADIQTCDKKLKHEKETAVILEKERVKLKREADRQIELIETLEYISKEIENIREKAMIGTVNLEEIEKTFTSLQKEHSEEYKLHNLSCLALSFGLPLMVKIFQGWEPLLQPLHGTDAIHRWKGLLQGEDAIDFSIFPDVNSYGNSLGDSPYAQLVMEAVFPAVRYVATNIWEPRDPEPMIKFLEIWENLLPKPVLNTILEHVILPKLTMAVDCWDPRQETVAIHEWLHPWLPYLGQRLEPLYHPIRFKLGDALRAWHPSDRSAYLLLSPWQPVFDPGSWEQLLVRSIVPKLIGALQELVINPQSQQLQPFHWVMEWAAAIPIHHMVSMLEAVFFPKWHQVLYHWLCSNPDLVEVTEWYLGWKSQFSDDLRANERIRTQLQIALDMMDKAVQGMAVVPPGARENVSYLRVTEKRQFETQQQHRQQAASYAQRNASVYGNQGPILSENGMGAPEMSLKEIVEGEAEKNDVMFLPKVGRMHEGLQVYGFGSVSICMDNAQQRMYAQTGERWIPVSIDQILEMHRALSQQPSRWK